MVGFFMWPEGEKRKREKRKGLIFTKYGIIIMEIIMKIQVAH
jgi:hypothetical protein